MKEWDNLILSSMDILNSCTSCETCAICFRSHFGWYSLHKTGKKCDTDAETFLQLEIGQSNETQHRDMDHLGVIWHKILEIYSRKFTVSDYEILLNFNTRKSA